LTVAAGRSFLLDATLDQANKRDWGEADRVNALAVYNNRGADDYVKAASYARDSLCRGGRPLKRAIEGLAWVLRRGVRFDLPPSVEKAQAEWLRCANPLASFVAERCVREREWASENGVTLVQQKNTMSRNLSLLGYKAKHGRQGTIILGLKLRSAWEGQPDRSRTVYRSS